MGIYSAHNIIVRYVCVCAYLEFITEIRHAVDQFAGMVLAEGEGIVATHQHTVLQQAANINVCYIQEHSLGMGQGYGKNNPLFSRGYIALQSLRAALIFSSPFPYRMV